MKAIRHILVGCVVALALTASSVRAALVVTEGGFEAPVVADGSTNNSITNWFDSTVNFSSYVFRSSTQLQTTSQMMSFEAAGGWIYQSLGTRSTGEDSISFTFDAVERGPTNRRTFASELNFALFAGSFTGADGTDITAGGGLASVGTTITVLQSDIFTTAAADEERVNGFTTSSLDLSGVVLGTQIWLRIGAVTGTPTAQAAYIDNLSANVTAIPEPSAALLGGLGLLALLRRRR